MRPVLAAALACVFVGAPGWARARGIQKLVPADFAHKTDAMGFRWDIQRTGIISDGTSDCFDNGAALMVNGQQFNATRSLMTRDRSELVLTANMGALEVTRRIRVDVKACGARYLEMLKNTGRKSVSATVSLKTYLGGSCQTVVSDTGSFAVAALGKKDGGILAVQRQGTHRPSVVFSLAGPRSKVKPALAIQGNRMFQFHYRLTVPPGKTVSLLHTVAQRRLGGTPNPKTLATMFKPFRSRDWVRDLPSKVRRTIINMRGFAGVSIGAPELLTTLDELGIERGKIDVLIVEEEARLSGEASCKRLSVRTSYGKADVGIEEVAALFGGAGVGRPMRLYLRNGEVLVGRVEAEGLELVTTGGMTIQLPPAQLSVLVMRALPTDGKPPKGAAALLATHSGNRLALSADRPIAFDAATPWGPLGVTLDQLEHISYVREPQPCHRLALTDGTRLSVILRGTPLAPASLRFGAIKVAPHAIAMLKRLKPQKADKKPEEEADEDEELTAAHAILIGENRLVGVIDLPTLRVATPAGVTPLDPKQVLLMERRDDESAGSSPVFTFELRDGGTLWGRFQERVLPIRSGQRVLRVPVEHLVSFRGAKEPEAKEEAKKEAKNAKRGEKRAAAKRPARPPVRAEPEEEQPAPAEVRLDVEEF